MILDTSQYGKDIPGAKWKIGMLVRYSHPTFGTGVGTITAMADTGSSTGDSIEYQVDSIPCLLWESEITGESI